MRAPARSSVIIWGRPGRKPALTQDFTSSQSTDYRLPLCESTVSPFALPGEANEHCRSRGQSRPAQPRPQDAVNAVFPANWVKFGQARAQS
ncbi:hypothetical protein CGLO_04287 [Colletotrichum gloeosporioides Cg-14]|uniref:Uncharacterized protein n=1 Tax=Colletotrichum gloeosporioides (strain Cg-14) TaxID=1237896 RepID=T0KUH7_COLGC|nr:hypothetical protein CGLO_04287 [Colletotrichum gloeosporioides Cg-14]